MKLFKKLYGAGIIFFYFIKYPVVIGLPIAYSMGMPRNPIMDGLAIYCLVLVTLDLVVIARKIQDKRFPEDKDKHGKHPLSHD